jgi:hypothetical protein
VSTAVVRAVRPSFPAGSSTAPLWKTTRIETIGLSFTGWSTTVNGATAANGRVGTATASGGGGIVFFRGGSFAFSSTSLSGGGVVAALVAQEQTTRAASRPAARWSGFTWHLPSELRR